MAALLGTSYLADIFYLAFKIPNLFRRVLAEGGMSAAFIPLFNQLGSRKNHFGTPISERNFFSLILLCLTAVSLLLTGSIILFASELSEFLFYWSQHRQTSEAFETKKIEQITLLIQIMMPYLSLVSLSALYQSVLQSKQCFRASTIPPILFNLTLITSATSLLLLPDDSLQRFFSNYPDPAYLKSVLIALSVVVGGTFQFLYPWWKTRQIYFSLNFKAISYRSHPILRKFLVSMIPILLSSGIYQIGVLVIDPIALSLKEGTVSFLFYSNRLLELPLGIIGVSLTTVTLPLLSKKYLDADQVQFHQIFKRTINLLCLITPPVLFVSLTFHQEIVSLVFKFKKFDDPAVRETATCFLFHIGSLPAIFLYRLLIHIFYSKNNTHTPLLAGGIGLGSNLFLAIVFTQLNPEPYSIAIASSISSYFVVIFLLWQMKSKLGIDLTSYLWDRTVFYLLRSCLPTFSTLTTLFAFRLILTVTNWENIFKPFWMMKLIQFTEISSATTLFLIGYLFLLDRAGEEEITEMKKKWIRKISKGD